MTDFIQSEKTFLSLLRARRKRRAAIFGSFPSDTHGISSTFVGDNPAGSTIHSEPLLSSLTEPRPSEDGETNLSTHYLFSSSRPQNEIQNPYPNCFEGYPKLQRLTTSA